MTTKDVKGKVFLCLHLVEFYETFHETFIIHRCFLKTTNKRLVSKLSY